MFKIKTLAAMGLLAMFAACGGGEEEVTFVDPDPVIVPEPTFQGKYS